MDTRLVTPLDYLYGLELHGIKLGLDNITRLLEHAGNPHTSYPTIHVGGTNGKGSVVAMLDSMLRAAGYKVGRFTSPHLCDIRERFLVDAEPVPADTLNEHIEFFRQYADSMSSPPTFFEMNTAIAFRFFEQSNVDIAVVEVGMGGRFDATNVIMPEAAGITNIAFEHTQYLGDTLQEIAFEKAGIIKEGVPLATTVEQPRPREVILGKAKETDSPVRLLERDFSFELTGTSLAPYFSYKSKDLHFGPLPLGLAGHHQGKNAALATSLAETLRPKFLNLDQSAIQQGLTEAYWPCRLEKVLNDPPVILDVAHNAAGMEKLAESLPHSCVVVLATATDKDAKAIIHAIAPKAHTLILSKFEGHRAKPVDELAEAAGDIPYRRTTNLSEAIQEGMDLAAPHRPLLITGSFFTAGEARTILVEKYGLGPIRF